MYKSERTTQALVVSGGPPRWEVEAGDSTETPDARGCHTAFTAVGDNQREPVSNKIDGKG